MRRRLLLFISVWLFTRLAAQDTLPPPAGIPFATWMQQAESLYGYRIFFADTSLPLRRMAPLLAGQPLAEQPQKALAGSGLYVSVAEPFKHIFITRSQPLTAVLPPAFFEPAAPGGTVAVAPDRSPTAHKLHTGLENRLFVIGQPGGTSGVPGRVRITGYVRDARNGEAISGATVYIDSLSTGAVTDAYGYYAVTIPTGRHTLHVSSLGMQETRRQVLVHADGSLNVELTEFVPSLKKVIVTTTRQNNLRSTQMGLERLSIRTIKQVPVVFGEADVLRVVMALPGVTSAGESSTGINVRGGSTDQNLILLNDATIYNPSHLFGFFSAFNPDIIKSVELYKSAIPVKYGGRLSSVLDVSTKDGNDKKLSGNGGIGLLTGKLSLEGPLVKDKSSFILGVRSTYSNWLLKNLRTAYRNSEASFHDANLNISHGINSKNSFYLTAYISHDDFKLNNDTSYRYGNKNLHLRWKHVFNNRLYSVFSAGVDDYGYGVSSEQNRVNAFAMGFRIRQASARADLNLRMNNQHAFNFGLNTVYYSLQPGVMEPKGTQSLVKRKDLGRENALEAGLYFAHQYHVNADLSVQAGLRYSFYGFMGPGNVYGYVPGVPKEPATIVDTFRYGRGRFIQTYHGPEIRLSMRYAVGAATSVKLSYNTLRQYIHMLSNTTVISPTDTWKLSDAYIRPQMGSQLSLGLYRNFGNNSIETSVEVYYKQMKQFLDYKSGAELLLNEHIETDVISSRGRAYGAELMIKKTMGKFNGWISYTWSRTELRSDDPEAGERVNKGAWYPASFDKPHQVNVISNYRFSHRLSVSFNFVYNTGRPVTIPIAAFTSGGGQRLLYSDRNQYRIPDYLRSDLSINLDGNHKLKQRIHNSWSLGVYNLFARKNAYSVYFVQEGGAVKGYQMSIFATAIPFITYNFRF